MINLPLELVNKFEIHIDPRSNHIHLFDLGSRQPSKQQTEEVIKKICEYSNIISIDWNWIVYAQGKVFRFSHKFFPLHHQDESLYTPFKKRMFLTSPLRGI